MFYTINQNNSGGYFILNEDVSQYVIVEANNVEEAKSNLYKITKDYLKFCPCCGERWDTDYLTEDDASEKPSIYGEEVYNIKRGVYRDECIIYYLDGRKQTIKFNN